jgi:DsbC/DsbD-like thiol-disulfide interchange protein
MMLRIAAVLALFASPALAAPVSPWAGDVHGQARLVAGGAQDDTLRAGLEIRLAPGWTTYWKAPGDSGIPPHFDWSGSRNVAAVTVRWPVPGRFVEGGATVFGYRGDVILPLRIRVKETGRPATLALTLRYAVCKDICVPAHAKLSLGLAATGTADAFTAARLAGFRARVPQPARLGAEGDLAIEAVRLAQSGQDTALLVRVRAPAGGEVRLFAAARDGGAGVPQPLEKGQWRVPLASPAAARALQLVLAAGGRAITVPVSLDAPGGAP